MLPDIDVRLHSLVKAVEQVILPALPAHERLAREQAALMLGHLRVLIAQWKYPLEFARLSARNMRTLAAALVPLADEDERVALSAATGGLADMQAMGFDEIEAQASALGALIERICGRPRADAEAETAFRAAIFAHTRRQEEIESTWFSGMAPDAGGEAPLKALLAADG